MKKKKYPYLEFALPAWDQFYPSTAALYVHHRQDYPRFSCVLGKTMKVNFHVQYFKNFPMRYDANGNGTIWKGGYIARKEDTRILCTIADITRCVALQESGYLTSIPKSYINGVVTALRESRFSGTEYLIEEQVELVQIWAVKLSGH